MALSPGGWSQVASKLITSGKILSIDIKGNGSHRKCEILKSDILNNETENKIIRFFKGKIDVIISDMAADTTGNKSLDSSEQINYALKY